MGLDMLKMAVAGAAFMMTNNPQIAASARNLATAETNVVRAPEPTSADGKAGGVFALVAVTVTPVVLGVAGKLSGTAEAAEGFIYRGVSARHPALEAALEGRVVPGDIAGTVTEEAHNLGGQAANSPFTSWTHDLNEALWHANKDGPGGVVLSFPLGPPPPGAGWSWTWSPDAYGEMEVLLKGARDGAMVIRP
jgi:hypothetical protein